MCAIVAAAEAEVVDSLCFAAAPTSGLSVSGVHYHFSYTSYPIVPSLLPPFCLTLFFPMGVGFGHYLFASMPPLSWLVGKIHLNSFVDRVEVKIKKCELKVHPSTIFYIFFFALYLNL